MINALNASLSGLQTATNKVAKAAENIANATTEGQDIDLAQEAVNLKLGEIQYKANLITLEATNELSEELGRLFDKTV